MPNRRHVLGAAVAAATAAGCRAGGPRGDGIVVGDPAVDGVGMRILADGGNAVDAVVATALAGAVVWPYQTGFGGYGAHGVFAVDGGRRLVALDANTAAPSGATADMFAPGGPFHGRNLRGWIPVGVPAVLAGVQAVLEACGTLRLADALRPATALARYGFVVPPRLARAVAGHAGMLSRDPGSARLYLPDGVPLRAGAVWRNPALADLLDAVAAAGSAEPFYRGAIADRIADAVSARGGLLRKADLAAYEARIVPPLALPWRGHVVHTAPLTAGGASVLQMLRLLDAIDRADASSPVDRLAMRVEAMRLAWRDRLTLLGDPRMTNVPLDRLLSVEYAGECAAEITAAVRSGRPLEHRLPAGAQGGTLHFSGRDGEGNYAALTLTHGEWFGACVTIEDLGLTLGHGMSRFDTDPEHPNCPGPAKRPLNNMCPTVVTSAGRAVVAVGGRGGRRIPNAVFEFLVRHLGDDASLAAAVAAPRLHTDGTRTVEFEAHWPADERRSIASRGFVTKVGDSAVLAAVGGMRGRSEAATR